MITFVAQFEIFIMKNILVLFVLSLLIFSCKQDPKSSESGNNETPVDLVSKGQRYQDSLKIVNKLKSKDQPVTAEIVQKLLNEGETKIIVPKDENGFSIPNVCSILKEEDIAAAFGISASDIRESSGNRGNVPGDTSKSCFWRWSNSGLLIQVSTNPLPEEVTDWGTRYINTKKSTGERMMGENEGSYIFKDFDGPGKHNIYNDELGRYYSAIDEDYIVALIFNGNFDSKKKLEIASDLMGRIIRRM